MTSDIEDSKVTEVIDICILDLARKVYISIDEKEKLKGDMFNSIRRLDVLSDLLEMDSVTEIMINNYKDIFIEEKGSIKQIDIGFQDEIKLIDVIQQIVGGCNRIVNEASPIVDARLADGSRVNVVLPPIALNGPTITIRKFPDKVYTMEDLINRGSLSSKVACKLRLLVRAGYNIFISGGTGSGKTTFLNALTNYVPGEERIITIEDSAELRIEGIPNIVRLEARNANVEGEKIIAIRDLIKTALRMRPDRIIVGEVRDGAALDMISAMNTGHDGSLSTGHANSAFDMLSRLEMMVLMAVDMPLVAIRQQISSAVDIIIHLGRLRDRSRKVLEICEVAGFQDGKIILKTLYKFEEVNSDINSNGEKEENIVKGGLVKVGKLEKTQKLIQAGLNREYVELDDI